MEEITDRGQLRADPWEVVGVGEPKVEIQGNGLSWNLWKSSGRQNFLSLRLSNTSWRTHALLCFRAMLCTNPVSHQRCCGGSDFIAGTAKRGTITRWPTVSSGWHTPALSLVCWATVPCWVAPPGSGREEEMGSAVECYTIISLRKPVIVTAQWGKRGLVICIIAPWNSCSGHPSPWLALAHHGDMATLMSSEENKPLRNRNSS